MNNTAWKIESYINNSSTTNKEEIKKITKQIIDDFGSVENFQTLINTKMDIEEINKYSKEINILAYVNLIKIPEKYIFDLEIWTRYIKQACPSINEFYETAKVLNRDIYGYNNLWFSSNLREYIRMNLFFNFDDKKLKLKFEHYIKKLKQSKHKDSASVVIKVTKEFKNIIYNHEKDIINVNTMNKSIEFSKYLKVYVNYINKFKSQKTCCTTRSHLKNFFDFLFEFYPNVITFDQLKNEHIKDFINRSCNDVTNATINHRIDEVTKFLNYVLKIDNEINIKLEKIITPYDKLKEFSYIPLYKSKEEINGLINLINSIDKKYLQEKLILILLFYTGRRVHEILTLDYNCLYNENLFLDKTKKGTKHKIKVGKEVIKIIKEAQKIVEKHEESIYSSLDKKYKRRLFASEKNFFKNVVSITSVSKVLRDIQIERDFVDSNGKVKFKIHDLKKVAISNLESAGISIFEISSLLDQSIQTISQYEIRNEIAFKTLKKLENAKTLIGQNERIENDNKKNYIERIINSKNIMERNKNNLIEKLQNPERAIPLLLGSCTDIESINLCGSLFCMACENFIIVSESDIKKFDLFCKKFYRHNLKLKKARKAKDIHKDVETKIKKVMFNKLNMSESEVKKKIADIKKEIKNEEV